MPLDRQVIGSAAFAAFALASGSALAASDPTGVWVNDTGRGAIEIKQCGEGLCGHVVWVKDPTDTKGCGRQIIGDATPAGSGTWDNGWIYSPEKKKKYDVELKPLSDGNLRVTGYAGTKLFSKKMIWTPAPADLVRCGSEQTSAATPAAAPAAPAAATTATTVTKAASIEELKLREKTAPAGQQTTAATPAPAAPAADAKSPAAVPAPAATPAPAAPEEEVAEEDSEGGLAEKLGEFIQKGPDGKCKLDLPWVKVDFKCDGEKAAAE
jgi:uncharacterized protein (DUF2147 family)